MESGQGGRKKKGRREGRKDGWRVGLVAERTQAWKVLRGPRVRDGGRAFHMEMVLSYSR